MASEGPRQGTPSVGGSGGANDWPEHTEGGLGATDGCFGKAEDGFEHTQGGLGDTDGCFGKAEDGFEHTVAVGGLGAADGGFGKGEDQPEQSEGGPTDTVFVSAESGTGDDVLHKGGCHCGAIIWQVTAPANPTGAPANMTL